MSQDKQIDILKNACYDLCRFKDTPAEYEKAVYKVEQIVTKLRLDNIVDPGEISFFLLTHSQPLLSNPMEFRNDCDALLKVKKTSFFFQLPELAGFPDNYLLGYGKLRSFDSLPRTVRDFATGLTEGKVGRVRTEQERVKTIYLDEMSIPRNPRSGCWFEISNSGISGFIQLNKAIQAADESLDILRILRPHIRIPLPQYIISKNTEDRTASFEALNIELYKYHFDEEEQKLIDRLNDLVVNPRCDLEKRILNALHFYRIGRNFSPEDQEVFFYVAAIEKLVIGNNDRDVLKWKFSEKAAFLLEDDLNGRMEIVSKLKDLYDARSTIAHGGMSQEVTRSIPIARDYLFRIIKTILELIDKRGLQSVSSNGAKDNTLDKYIDQIKYSGKTSRASKRNKT